MPKGRPTREGEKGSGETTGHNKTIGSSIQVREQLVHFQQQVPRFLVPPMKLSTYPTSPDLRLQSKQPDFSQGPASVG